MEQLPALRDIRVRRDRSYGHCGSPMDCLGTALWLQEEESRSKASREWSSGFAWKPREFTSAARACECRSVSSSFPRFANVRLLSARRNRQCVIVNVNFAMVIRLPLVSVIVETAFVFAGKDKD
jgi:hypothetical protein